MELKGTNTLNSFPEDNILQRGDYHKLVESLPAAIYTCDEYGRITFYNEAAAILWGREPELGKDLWCGSWKIYSSDGEPMELDKCPMAITLKEGRAVQGMEIIIERPDGMRRYILPHPKPIFDASGRITGAVNMLIDITEKKVAEEMILDSERKFRQLSDSLEKKVVERTLLLEKKNEELKKSEERYHKMVEEVQDYAILLLDKDGFVQNWNKGAEKIKGYKESEILGKNFRIFYLEEDQREKLPEKLIQEAREKGRATHEGWRVRKDGSRFWGSIVITALQNDEKNIMGFSKVTRDLTERKLAEDKLKQYTVELERKNNELEQYAFIASHDLQEPLRKIQTYSSLLDKNLDDEISLRRNIEKINSSAKRMTVLIRDVLNYSRFSKSDEEFIETDLNQVLENTKEDFELLIREKNATIRHSVLPIVKGIPIQLHQLFSNILSNSLKFNDGNPVIDITSTILLNEEVKNYPKLNPEKAYFKLTFKDNGIGFEPQYAEQIFNLFQSLNDRNKYSGTGLGLALCKKIVGNHNGLIEVKSEINKGATFNIYLPAS